MKHLFKHVIRRHRFRQPWEITKDLCEKYLRAYYNEAYWDFSRNGERRVIEVLSQYVHEHCADKTLVVFDVGAHKGTYARTVLQLLPESSIYCFEPVPKLAQAGSNSFQADSRVTYLNKALSSKSGTAQIVCSHIMDTTNSMVPRMHSTYFPTSDETTVIDVETITGDEVMREWGLTAVDFLKIDVEGHEIDVLEGFGDTFASGGRPLLIQFEYGDTYIPAGRTLMAAYSILSRYGYEIGRVYPNCVAFKPYELSDEHFRMGNYLAAPRGSVIRMMLSGIE